MMDQPGREVINGCARAAPLTHANARSGG